MTWTYTPGAGTALSRVRFAIGDTDTTDQQLADEEIADLLILEGNYLRAAVTACESLAARYARLVTTSIDGEISKQYSDLASHYETLVLTLRRRVGRSGSIVPYAGGLSISEKQGRASDDDAVKPFFTRGMETEPGTEQVDADTPFPTIYPI